MFKYRIIFMFLSVLSKAAISRITDEGEDCTSVKNKAAKCRKIADCPSAVNHLYNSGLSPRICDFEDLLPLVCCDEAEKINQSFETKNRVLVKTGNMIASGGKSQEKCSEYSNTILKKLGRKGDECFEYYTSQSKETSGGYKVLQMEFPHMALLGYASPKSVTWGCTGTLISDRFILTAAHCLKNAFGRNVAAVKLGNGNETSKIIIKVIESIPHPNYSPETHYNDIALLKLEKPIEFDFFVRPACLLNQDDIMQGISTKWDNGQLKLSVLDVFSHPECSAIYEVQKSDSIIKINETSQFCAGGPDFENNRCIPEVGGPIQHFLNEPFCMYNIFGISSFGIRCGRVPRVHTRVSNYIPWIESIIWV